MLLLRPVMRKNIGVTRESVERFMKYLRHSVKIDTQLSYMYTVFDLIVLRLETCYIKVAHVHLFRCEITFV